MTWLGRLNSQLGILLMVCLLQLEPIDNTALFLQPTRRSSDILSPNSQRLALLFQGIKHLHVEMWQDDEDNNPYGSFHNQDSSVEPTNPPLSTSCMSPLSHRINKSLTLRLQIPPNHPPRPPT